MATTIFEKPMGSEVETLKGQIGTLSSLTTSAKSSAVAAINEVNSKLTWKQIKRETVAAGGDVSFTDSLDNYTEFMVVVAIRHDAERRFVFYGPCSMLYSSEDIYMYDGGSMNSAAGSVLCCIAARKNKVTFVDAYISVQFTGNATVTVYVRN